MTFQYTDEELKQIADGYVDEIPYKQGKYVQVDYLHDTKFYPIQAMYDDEDIVNVSIVQGWGVEYIDEDGMMALEVFDNEDKAIAFSKEVGG